MLVRRAPIDSVLRSTTHLAANELIDAAQVACTPPESGCVGRGSHHGWRGCLGGGGVVCRVVVELLAVVLVVMATSACVVVLRQREGLVEHDRVVRCRSG